LPLLKKKKFKENRSITKVFNNNYPQSKQSWEEYNFKDLLYSDILLTKNEFKKRMKRDERYK
jgi:hypothetical protein